tara:strand:+ start:1100 stop:1381 length:282 start_codon:yes stop_codon:yes gene_type:complete
MSYTDNDYLLDNLSGEVKEYCDYLLDDEEVGVEEMAVLIADDFSINIDDANSLFDLWFAERFKKEVSSKEVGECNKVVFKHDCRCSKRESVLL